MATGSHRQYFLVAGTARALAPIRDSHGPLIVADLAQTQRLLEQAGAVITPPLPLTPTGTRRYARHPDGSSSEYVQWLPEPVDRPLTKRRAEVPTAPPY